MTPGELLQQAWAAVKASGVPKELYDTAFKEAVAYLREDVPHSGVQTHSRGAPPAVKAPAAKARPASANATAEEKFFAQLAHESGASEEDLRDVLHLTGDGVVIVTKPTKDLGKSQGEQSRVITALVAGARSKGLDEKPVDAGAVRTEIKRKGCFDTNNYAAKHLGIMKGFNYGATNKEMVLTSKWVGEFMSALDTAHGRSEKS